MAVVLLFLALAPPGWAFKIIDTWSPHNGERPARKRTQFIILHTTEAPAQSALNKLRENGETHFFVNTNGNVYRVIDKRRIALHCGRSMWDGLSNIDEYSIGIEVAGYHDRDITPAQYATLRQVLVELQQIYRIPDLRVLSHSMVAYGAPNRWHPRSHRGRKRCGMLFGRESVRQKLGLNAKPSYDPDVKAGRLVSADPGLARILYGLDSRSSPATTTDDDSERHGNIIGPGRSAWDIARDRFDDADTLYLLPNGTKLRGTEVKDWKSIPVGTQVLQGAPATEGAPDSIRELGTQGDTAQELAGDEARSPTTLYFLADGKVRSGAEMKDGDLKNLPGKTRVLVGYASGGAISAQRRAFDICGKRWNFPSTCYRFPDGSLKTGNLVKESGIPTGTLVFYRR
jgi:hypothetical protein